MTRVSQDSTNTRMLADRSGTSVRLTYEMDKSATRIDIALLVSALFLQRFALPVSTTFLGLDFVAIGLILSYQFLRGNLLIQYDRLLWFLAFALAITSSLLLNFNSTMLTAYSQFMVFNLLFTLSRRSTSDQYKKTLQGFQFIAMLLSYLAVAQLVAEFVGEYGRLTKFYGIFPDFLFGAAQINQQNVDASSHFRSNGIFLSEASALSQITALGILIEVLEFRRPRYLLVMVLGFLLSYSGTGSMLLLFFLPLIALRDGRAGNSTLLVAMFVLGLLATGIIDLSAFTSRTGEFEDTRASGFSRFVSPFWLAAKRFDTVSLQALLIGGGPGTAKTFGDALHGGGSLATWFKLFYEYGIIGSFVFVCFLASCFRKSRCPGLVVAAIIFAYGFLQGMMTIAIVLCTLSGAEPRRARVDETNQNRSSLVVGSAAG
jgi:hypothetical protein